MAKKRKRKRERGGASHPCPKCGEASHVQVTRRSNDSVERQRECLNCGAVFRTREQHFVEKRA